jgi:hypothetical protein
MTAEPKNVLAGIAGLGNPFELAWVGDAGVALPTTATVALDAGFKSMGIVSELGADGATNVVTQEMDAYGAFSPIRTLITSEVRTFKLVGRETNLATLALKSRQKLSSVSADGTGHVSITEGAARDVLYSLVIHAVDGVNVVRKVMPSVRVTAIDNEQIAKAQNLAYGLTFTAYPDSSGNSVYSYYVLAGYGAS